jgi:hypothetical protein
MVILENFVLKIYIEFFLGCHTDNGGILVLIEKLSGKDVSFVDMTAGEVVSSRSA